MFGSKCIFVLAVTYWLFGLVLCQGEPCFNQRRERGICINLNQCTPLRTLLENAPQPRPQSVLQELAQANCGFDKLEAMVCCVESVTSPVSRVESVTSPVSPVERFKPVVEPLTNLTSHSIINHPNLSLLPTDCGISDGNRILGGKKTGVLEYPWMALIAYNTKQGSRFQCGGTIINERYILTAAHCITNLDGVTLAGVRIGEHDISQDQDCIGTGKRRLCYTAQDLVIEETIPHPMYVGIQRGRSPRLQNDIGLIRLSANIDMEADNILTVCLPITRELQELELINVNVTIAGWGTTEAGATSPDLLKINIPIMPNTQCGQIMNGSVEDGVGFRQVCAGGIQNIDACNGDSGGPMLLEGRMNGFDRLVQQGIVSFGPRKCGQANIPGVYTRVAYYMDWVLDQLRR